jgi:hypothetical protein
LIRTWSPCDSITEASVTCGMPRRSASMAGTTEPEASVEAIPQITTSAPASALIFSIALANTSDVAM